MYFKTCKGSEISSSGDNKGTYFIFNSKNAVLSQGNLAMPQLFSVKVRRQHSLQV